MVESIISARANNDKSQRGAVLTADCLYVSVSSSNMNGLMMHLKGEREGQHSACD